MPAHKAPTDAPDTKVAEPEAAEPEAEAEQAEPEPVEDKRRAAMPSAVVTARLNGTVQSGVL